jgi:hypothetical protein
VISCSPRLLAIVLQVASPSALTDSFSHPEIGVPFSLKVIVPGWAAARDSGSSATAV